MSRGWLGACAGGIALALLGAWWWLGDEGARSDEHVPRTPGAVEAHTEQPALPGVDAPRDVTPASSVPEAPTAAAPESLAPVALEIRVRHASGDPAIGGIIALYRSPEELLAHGVLDGAGRYRHAGFDGFVHVVVVGVSARPAQLRLADGHGSHEIELDAGAALTGRVLVNGVAPDRPIPVALHGVSRRRDLPCKGRLVPVLTMPDTPGAVGHLFTDARGHFRVSGVEPGAQVGVWGPGGPYETLPDLSTEAPVTLPFDGYVLALRRKAVLRGRVLHADGSLAHEAELELVAEITRGPAPVDDVFANRFPRKLDGVRMDGDARFAVDLLGQVGINCRDAGSPREREPSDCGPLVVDVELEIVHPNGTRLGVKLDALDPLVDHDLGDLVLREPDVVTLHVRDTAGAPVEGARVRPEGMERAKEVAQRAALSSDVEGVVRFLRTDARHNFASVVAEGYDAEWVDLREHTRSVTLDVTLQRSAGVRLEVTWPPGAVESGTMVWLAEISGEPPLFQDHLGARERSLPGRPGPHALRGSRGLRRVGDTLFVELTAIGGELHIDGLRSRHPLRLRLLSSSLRRLDEDDDEADHVYWEADPLWLERGEQRVLRVDLSHVELQR